MISLIPVMLAFLLGSDENSSAPATPRIPPTPTPPGGADPLQGLIDAMTARAQGAANDLTAWYAAHPPGTAAPPVPPVVATVPIVPGAPPAAAPPAAAPPAAAPPAAAPPAAAPPAAAPPAAAPPAAAPPAAAPPVSGTIPSPTSTGPYRAAIPRFIVNESGDLTNPAEHDAAVRLYTAQANGENLSTAQIRALQSQMGIGGDGIIGDGTREAIATLLIGQNNAAGNVDQRISALKLSMYLFQGGSSTGTIRNLQIGMGGITADGVRGPQTDSRMRALLASP